MTSISIICGILLVVLGVGGYCYGLISGNASPTALIPAIFGIVLIACGAVAASKEGLRKHLMHAALTVGLIGFLITAIRLIMKAGSFQLSAAFISQLAMAIICLIFLILGIRSFVAARKARDSA